MSFSPQVVDEITAVAKQLSLEPASLLAVAYVESGGTVFAIVDGRQEPLIRFEGHYFHRRLTGNQLATAIKEGLASPTAGAVVNPTSQSARWKMLNRAAKINAQAAFESCSWGIGQVMGSHWSALGYGSVSELVNRCRSGAAGQAELMARFIKWAGLTNALRNHDWKAFARGYNGAAYAKNQYDTKMAAAYARFKNGGVAPADNRTRRIQEMLNAAGYTVTVDGLVGPKTIAAIKAFQANHGLAVDAIVGPATWAALEKASAGKAPPKPAPAQTPSPTTPPAANAHWLTTLLKSALQALGRLFSKGS